MNLQRNLLIGAVLISTISCSSTRNDGTISLPDTLVYTVKMQFNDAGFHKVWQDGDIIKSVYQFNDRGRGPELESSIILDAQGLITSLQTTGKSYMKGTVEETFSVANGAASWQNAVENFSEVALKDKFYLSYHGVPFETSLLLRAILKTQSGKIPVMPGGEVTASKITTHQLESYGKLDLFAIKGLDFTPTYVWVDKDQHLFATVSGWLTVIREEYKDDVKTLIDLQRPYQDSFYTSLSDELTIGSEDMLILKDGNVFDAKSGKLNTGWSVVISGNEIVEVGPWESFENKEGEVIDVSGKTILPGLWDMHGHISDVDGILNVAAGVTTARDLANNPYELPARAKAFESEEKIGPRIIMAGFVDGTGPYQGPISREFLAASLEEGLAVIDRYDSLGGYEQIKMYSSISPAWVKPMAEKAHESGFRVSGHIPAFMTAEQAVLAGYDEIQHINMLFLNFMGDTLDTRSPLRFTAVAQYGGQLDLAGQPFRNFIQLLSNRKIVVDPTVSIFEGMFVSRPLQADPAFETIIDRLPVNVQRGFREGGLEVDDEKDILHRQTFDKALSIIGELYTAGVPLVAGTDNLAGFTLHRELENYVRAGIPEADVLRIATYQSAQVTGRSDNLGLIEAGYLADLVIIDGNPVREISDIRKTALVIKNGKRFNPAQLYDAIGVKRSN